MPQERILLHSGFYGVLLPDGRRMLEKPPVGQIVEGGYPLPRNADYGAGGESPFFRVLNVNGRHYVVQYSPDKYPIVLEYTLNEGHVLPSFEGPGDTVGIAGAGINRGHVNGWVPGSLWATGRAADVQNPVVGQTQPSMPTPTPSQPLVPIIADPRTPYTPPGVEIPSTPDPLPPVTGSGGDTGGGAAVLPGVYEPGTYYMTPQQTSMPPEVQPAAGIGAGALAVGGLLLFFLLGDDDNRKGNRA